MSISAIISKLLLKPCLKLIRSKAHERSLNQQGILRYVHIVIKTGVVCISAPLKCGRYISDFIQRSPHEANDRWFIKALRGISHSSEPWPDNEKPQKYLGCAVAALSLQQIYSTIQVSTPETAVQKSNWATWQAQCLCFTKLSSSLRTTADCTA